MSFLELEELKTVRSCNSLLRIPPQMDVPVTRRVLELVDAPAMRRLSRISQLGLVSLVYPGATHSRLEHSLGVYRNAVSALQHLAGDERFASTVDERSASLFLAAALLHDIGHWPLCHAIEDMGLPWVPRHETLARKLIVADEIAEILRSKWFLEPTEVADLIAHYRGADTGPLLANLLNGPIDIDKMDYLQRDSLHAGVPYGHNFDQRRLMASLCVGPSGNEIAISEKGKTAAEMMVFSRYVMFSEVYWHHAVRSATAMLQRLVFGLSDECDPAIWLDLSDQQMFDDLLRLAGNRPHLAGLAQGLFGRQRRLYKRLLQFNYVEYGQAHQSFARRPYTELVTLAGELAERLSRYTLRPLSPTDVLIDAPPVKLEVQFSIQVRMGGSQHFRALGEISPVVRSLATDHFDNTVKKVRVFIAPDRRDEIKLSEQQLVQELIATVNGLGG